MSSYSKHIATFTSKNKITLLNKITFYIPKKHEKLRFSILIKEKSNY